MPELPVRLAVPLYVHPAVDPRSWHVLESHAEDIEWVVVNAADGPGSLNDGILGAAIRGLLEAGVTVLGYVNAAYGRRPIEDMLADVERWRAWYAVTGAFLDQVPTAAGMWVRDAVRDVRHAGASTVVGNPGTPIDVASAHGFDGLVLFEGGLHRHQARGAAVDADPRHRVPTIHLVYGVPRDQVGETLVRVRAAEASAVWVTGGDGVNPYLGVPEYFPDLVRGVRALSAGTGD